MADSGLPPGQRAIDFFPRFGVPRYAGRMPAESPLELVLGGTELTGPVTLRRADLETLPRRERVADFHCVTTWTYRGLRWEGWGLRDVYEAFVVPRLRAGSFQRLRP